MMPKTAAITVQVADLPQIQAALADAEATITTLRRTLTAAIRGSCACESCKAHLADLVR